MSNNRIIWDSINRPQNCKTISICNVFAHVFLTSCDWLWLLLLLDFLKLTCLLKRDHFKRKCLSSSHFQCHHSLRAYCGPSPPPQVPQVAPSPDLRHLAHPKSRKHHRASVLPKLFLSSVEILEMSVRR